MKTLEGLLAVLSFLCGACTIRPAVTGSIPALEDEGSLYVYLQPLPHSAEGLKIHFSEITGVREDGVEIPLPLRISAATGGGPWRERLLAAGALPPGRYSGLAVRTGPADIPGEPPHEPRGGSEEVMRIGAPFAVTRRQGVVLSLGLSSGGPTAAGGRIVPAFSATVPEAIATGLIGVASSRGGNAVTAFDKVSGHVVSVIPTGRQPAGMALDQTLRRLYVAITGEDAIEVVDLVAGRAIDRVKLSSGDASSELALTLDGRTLLTANTGSNTVSVIDTKGLFETGRIPVGNGPSSVLLERSGRRAFVFNTLSDSITILNVPASAEAGTLTTESGPFRGQLSREGDRLYVVHRSSPYLTVFDTASGSLLRRVYVGSEATALEVDQKTGRIYLARRRTGTIDVYDPLSLLPVETIQVSGEAAFLAIDSENSNLFVVLPKERSVRTIGLVAKKTGAEVEVDEDPYWVSFMGAR